MKYIGKWFEFLKETECFSAISGGNVTEIIPAGFYGYVHSFYNLYGSYGMDIYYPDVKSLKCEVDVSELEMQNLKKFKELDENPFEKNETIKDKNMELPKKGARFQIDHKKLGKYIEKNKSVLSDDTYQILKTMKRLAVMGLDFRVTRSKFFNEDHDCDMIEINTMNGNYGPWYLTVELLNEIRRMYGS